MMAFLENYYNEKYPEAGFSVAWNKFECMAHVINLGAFQILKNFKQPIEKETYPPGTSSNDRMVTALSRLSFLVRKIRLSPKLRRLMQQICEEKGVKYLVPIINVSTRWNSTFDMLQCAIERKEIISDTFYRHKEIYFIKLLLDAEDWKSMDDLIQYYNL